MKNLYRALNYMRDVSGNKNLPVGALAMFSLICENEGITAYEIGQQLGLPSASISRYSKELGQYLLDGKLHGSDLIRAEPALDERRRLAFFLTPKGVAVQKRLLEILKGEN